MYVYYYKSIALRLENLGRVISEQNPKILFRVNQIPNSIAINKVLVIQNSKSTWQINFRPPEYGTFQSETESNSVILEPEIT